MINVDEDLIWYFCHSAAEMGACSSFEAIRYAIMSGGASKTSMPDAMTGKRLSAAGRNRKILQRLTAIRPQKYIDMIYAAYQPRNWGDYLWNTFDRATGVTPWSPAARSRYEEDSKSVTDDGFFAWLEGVVLRQETDRIQVIQKESKELLRSALKAYTDVRL